MAISLKKRTSKHCSGVTNVASVYGDCTDRVYSALSVAFSVTESVCLTTLLCVQDGGFEKEERVMQKVRKQYSHVVFFFWALEITF